MILYWALFGPKCKKSGFVRVRVQILEVKFELWLGRTKWSLGPAG
jgi:hypothetical protein